MMSPDVETHIKKNSSWSTLPQTVKQALGNIEGNWEQCVSDYCIKNQLRFKGSLVRQVRKDEKKYYKELIQHSRQHLMLYPYHLSDIVVKGLRLTPFSYYCNMMEDIMLLEKSYDSLPNFTAADCLRLLGIGRNQYIDMMNQCKSSKRFFRAKRPPRELLPVKPIAQTVIPTWWVANTGYITDDDVKLCSTEEIDLIDRLIDKGATPVHKLPQDTVRTLYNRGLIYMDVAIDGEDYIVVPPLENFVMNRVLGDYMETLLYKVFVSVDQHTTVAELAQVLELDLSLTKNAISLFCRLGLAVKKEGEEKHNSTEQTSLSNSRKFDGSSADLLVDFDDELPTLQSDSGSEKDLLLPDTMSDDIPTSPDCGIQQAKRIAFLFDSTLTAFLMMGNLSQGLKRHAVTMFEVGKLPDESLDNFVAELEKIENVTNEGEAQRYFDHAIVLKNTIQYLRKNPHLTTDESHSKLDLVRIESIANLDPSICGRILQKKYNMLVSMAPLSNEIRPITSCSPPHIGPAIPEVNSVWFKLFVYTAIKQGPPSLLLVKGTRLKKLPSFLRGYDKLLITTWSHDPAVVSTSNVLFSLNEALAHSPLLLQGHGIYGEGDALNIAFPFDDTKDLDTSIAKSVEKLSSCLDFTCTCGYVTFIDLTSRKHARRTADEQKTPSCWTPYNVCYGVPLFDSSLNQVITDKMVTGGLLSPESVRKMVNTSRTLTLQLLQFISSWNGKDEDISQTSVSYPTKCLMFKSGDLSEWKL